MFANYSLIDLLLIGVLAYFIVRMFRGRRGGGSGGAWNRPGGQDQEGRDNGSGGQPQAKPQPRPMDRHEAAARTWEYLGGGQAQPNTTPTGPGDGLPFDKDEFLEGAKLFFSRVQQADEPEELESLRPFLSDELFREISEDRRANGSPGEVMLLEARIMEANTEGDATRATVFFDAHMRRGQDGEETVHLRTAWEFLRDETEPGSLWTLDKTHKVDQ